MPRTPNANIMQSHSVTSLLVAIRSINRWLPSLSSDPSHKASSALGEALLHCHLARAELDDLVHKLLLLVHVLDVVRATNAHSIDQDVRHGRSARLLAQVVLEALAQVMFVQLDDKGCGFDVVLVEEEALGPFGEGAVCFGEDDD